MINYFSLVDFARVTSIYKKGGQMKRTIAECEDLDDYAAAMADAWREEQRVQGMLDTGYNGK